MSWSFDTAVRTIWQEARGEPLIGQQAVAHVLWNRLRDGRWGSTLACVCLAKYQFSGWNDNDPNRLAVAKVPDDDHVLVLLSAILNEAQNTVDFTHGAMWYYAASMKIAPPWAKTYVFTEKYGNQLFFKEK